MRTECADLHSISYKSVWRPSSALTRSRSLQRSPRPPTGLKGTKGSGRAEKGERRVEK